ncbi:MAG: HEAT repeat domain-containing protein [Desulfovibrio sp.]|nr:HEAT repeat domain-containing protein [Desulfovibrio sp.]
MNETTQNETARILQDLRSSDTETIRDAAFRAGEQGLAEAVPSLCEQIQSSNLGVQEAAEYALRKIRGAETVRQLLPLLQSETVSLRNVAMDILREIGIDDLDSMRAPLHGEDPDLRIFISDILGYCHSHKAALLLSETLLKDPEVNVRYQAAISLGNLAYPESVAALSQAMHDEEWVQFAVVVALAKIKDNSAISVLVQLLPKSTPLVCSAIIDALGDLGDIQIIPLLFNALDTVNSTLRHKIVKSLVKILNGRSLTLLQPKSQNKLHAYLLEALQDGEEDIQLAALQGLGAIGKPEATKKILAFASTLDPETKPELYEAAIRALAAIGYNEALGEALRSNETVLTLVALEVCRLLDDKAPLEDIKKIFWQVSIDVQRIAIAQVARLGSCDDMPFFLSVLDETQDGEILKNILFFLGNQQSCHDVDDIVFNLINHRYQDVKEMALEACIHLHSEGLNVRFKDLLKNGDEMQRMMATYALGRYDIHENIDDVSQALNDPSPAVRRVAIEAFTNLGNDIEHYIDRVIPALQDPAKDVRIAAITFLGQARSSHGVPQLLEALKDDDEAVQRCAIEALGDIGTEEAVPPLTNMLDHTSTMLIYKIIEALGKIGGNMAFNVLLGMMDNEDPEISNAVTEAVAAIQARQE